LIYRILSIWLLVSSVVFTAKVFANAPQPFVTIKWGKTENTRYYLLEIARDNGFKDIILKKAVWDPAYKWENPPVGNYYFRVAIVDKYRQRSEFSNPVALSIVPPAPKKVEASVPVFKNNFLFKLGTGYSFSQITQSSVVKNDNFLNMTGQFGSLPSLAFVAEWWPLGDSGWLGFVLDYSYSSINSNFVDNSAKLTVNKIGMETLVSLKLGSVSILGGLGYRRMPVFFIRDGGNTFLEYRHYFTQGVYIKAEPEKWNMVFNAGLQLSLVPSNSVYMPVLETYYLFHKWRLGIRAQYSISSMAADIISTVDQSVIASGSDINKNLAIYLMAGFRI
jgi:hypothetical protein